MDLSRYAGFPLYLEEATGRLRAPAPVVLPEPEPRRLEAMRPVLRDPGADGPDPLYWMYRGAGPPLGGDDGLRFDLTVLRPGTVGREAVKTFGHRHPCLPGSRWSYPEVYQVVEGRAAVLLQYPEGEEFRLLAVECGPGDVVVIPPGFAHATANVGEGWLVLANWVYAGFAADYGPVAARRGMAYYRLRDPDGWQPNPQYPAPVLRLVPPTPPQLLGLAPGQPVFALGAQHPYRLDWLRRPEGEPSLWRELSRFWDVPIPAPEGAGA